MMSESRYELLDLRYVGQTATRVHGYLIQTLFGSRLLCGYRAAFINIDIKPGKKEDITCRKCLAVLDKFD